MNNPANLQNDIVNPSIEAREQPPVPINGKNPMTQESSPLETICSDFHSQLTDERDRYLRLAADFDNFRKRTARESNRRTLELRDAFIRDLLPLVDNLERAIASIPDSQTAFKEGIMQTYQQFYGLLRQHGLEPEQSLGQTFDPHHHEAVLVRNDPQSPAQAVLEVWSRGWRRGDKIFRPAKVVVNSMGST